MLIEGDVRRDFVAISDLIGQLCARPLRRTAGGWGQCAWTASM
jgi:hypothetical protein